MQANEVRGEVDLELDGQRFVLRPSYGAILEAEKLTGNKSLIKLATLAGDGELSLTDTAVVVTTFIQAWGKATGDFQAQAVNASRIGELIHEYGLMKVQLRLTYVLTQAATGGYRADGTAREDESDPGEAPATGKKSATPVVSSRGSRAPRSAGGHKTSGTPRRTNSGARSRPGKR